MPTPGYQNDNYYSTARVTAPAPEGTPPSNGLTGSSSPEPPATVQHPEESVDLLALLKQEERDDLWKKCQHIAGVPQILVLLADQLRSCGLAGELRVAMIVFLALISRFLERVVSVVVKGPSGSGKSVVIESVLQFVPKTGYYVLSAMSDKALAFSNVPLSHRMLVLYEAAGLQSETANYLVRSLLSEGRVKYWVTVKTQSGYEMKTIEKEGPTGLITSTTRIQLHPENETRYISVAVDDTQKQTQRVMIASATQSTSPLPDDLKAWHALQDWLERGEHRVTIPFATTLASMIPPVAVRLRRDFITVLRLISSHAILHQATRQRDAQSRIVADHRDYKAVHMLMAKVLAEGVESCISPTVRETVGAVTKLTPQYGSEATLQQVAAELHLDKSAASRRVGDAVKKGYLRNLEARRGWPARLVLGDPLPDDMEILPDPKALETRCCSVAVDSEG